MPQNSLLQTNLLRRPAFGAWIHEASGGAGTEMISRDSIPGGLWIWSTQAVDKYGHKAVLFERHDHGAQRGRQRTNGRLNEAAAVTPPVLLKPATYAPAGDQDYYSFYAAPGDIIDAKRRVAGAGRGQ